LAILATARRDVTSWLDMLGDQFNSSNLGFMF
jgi:hypothetical protein